MHEAYAGGVRAREDIYHGSSTSRGRTVSSFSHVSTLATRKAFAYKPKLVEPGFQIIQNAYLPDIIYS